MIKKASQTTIIITIIFMSLLFLAGTVLAQTETLLYYQDFELGQLEGWWLESGWEVIDSDTSHVLAAGQGHVTASYNGDSWNDYRMRFRLKLVGDASLHANFRLEEKSSSRYLIGLNHADLYFVKQAGPDSFSENLASAPGLGDGWQTIEITGYGSTISVRVNDQVVMTYTDQEPLQSGGFSFESLTESQVLIDEVEIWGAGVVPVPIDAGPSTGEHTWVHLGGPPGGLGYDIRYNFDDPNTWYVTDANAGVHISYDNGLTWQQSNNGIGEFAPVYSLTVDPHNPQTIWIGTNETGRIYKSIDGGKNWVEKSQGVILEYEIWLSFRGFTVDPRTSDIVYAMGELQKPGNNVWGLGVGGVIYKTVDGGENWERIWNGAIPSSLTRYMWINPQNPDVLYVSTGIFDRGAVGETDIETDPDPFGGLGILKSTDGGQTWRVLGKENGLDHLYIGSLYMHPENPDILFAAAGHVASELAQQKFIQDNYSPLGIYRTLDGGETWEQVLKSERSLLHQVFSSVEICPSDSNIIYAGTELAIYRSDDGGDSWKRTSGGEFGWGPPGVAAGWPIDMQCDPRNPNRIFTNNYGGGNFLSEDGGKTWMNASTGYSGALIVGVSVNPYNPAHVFAGGRSGVWQSDDGGVTWFGIHNPGETQALAGGEWGAVAFDPSVQDHILLGGLEFFLEWSSNGNQWILQDFPENFGAGVSEIEFALSNPNIVYAVSASANTMLMDGLYEGGKGVAISRDGGSNWTGITGQQFSDAIITDVSIDPLNANIVYVASQIGLFKSQDSGSSWESLSSLSQGRPVRTVAVSPENPNKVFAGIPYEGFYTSDDGGDSWRQVVAGLEPNGNHRDMVFDPTNPKIVYLSDILSGIYQSTDAGETWIEISQGLGNLFVTSLSISSDGQHLYTAASGAGVFRLDLNGQPPEVIKPSITQSVSTPQDEPAAQDSLPDEPSDKPTFSLPCIGGLAPIALVGFAWISRRRR